MIEHQTPIGMEQSTSSRILSTTRRSPIYLAKLTSPKLTAHLTFSSRDIHLNLNAPGFPPAYVRKIKSDLNIILTSFLFEINDHTTRSSAANQVRIYLARIAPTARVTVDTSHVKKGIW